jgi:serine/threonine-protein kinase
MAAIYEGEDLVMNRPGAIKTLAPGKRYEDARRRLEREARFAAAVVHPNVCEVRDVGSLDEIGPYLVMGRLTGRTLGAHIGATGALPLHDVVDFATQLLSAVEAVHARGIAHRDVKPANVFLVERQGCGPLVKLLDFGAATEIGKPEDRPEGAVMTATGYIVGTPEYLSPEQIRGERVFRETVDVYACASGRRARDRAGPGACP